MERSFFRRTQQAPSSSTHDAYPLLPTPSYDRSQHNQHHNENKPYHDTSSPLSSPRSVQSHSTSPSERLDRIDPAPHPSSSRSGFSNGTGNGVPKSVLKLPPPPIVASIVLPRRADGHGNDTRNGSGNGNGASFTGKTRRVSFTGIGGLDPIMGLVRREKALQAELQELLDAQSEGLLRGGGREDTASDEGSTTTGPTASISGLPKAVVPVRQPRKKKIGLRAARRGILGCIRELGQVKGVEMGMVSEEVNKRKQAIERVEVWEEKISGLGKALGEREDTREIEELKTEQSAVAVEIREMEDRLAEMRARDRNLRMRVEELENRSEARLSSYRESLRLAQREAAKFLERPPVGAMPGKGSDEQDVDFMALPPKRRTLEMARSCWKGEIDELERNNEAVEKEMAALQDGAKMWRDAIDRVLEFEDGLREQMVAGQQSREGLKAQIGKMGDVIKLLEGFVQDATAKGWNLMVCAIGAELEAFKEGEVILRGALGDDVNVDVDNDEMENGSDGVKEESGHGEELQELGEGLGEAPSEEVKSEQKPQVLHDESEDDGPDPELLVSHEDTDGE